MLKVNNVGKFQGSPRRVPGVDMHQTGSSLLWIIVYLCFTTFLHSSHNYFCHLLHEKPSASPWKPLRRYCRKVCSLLLICRINCAETTIVLRCKTHSSWREIGEAANGRRRGRALCLCLRLSLDLVVSFWTPESRKYFNLSSLHELN